MNERLAKTDYLVLQWMEKLRCDFRAVEISGINGRSVFPILQKEIQLTEAQKENRIRKMLKEFNGEFLCRYTTNKTTYSTCR
jgi:hypothetical protein